MESNTINTITKQKLEQILKETPNIKIYDTRPKPEILQGYIPGSYALLVSPNFDSWVQKIIPENESILLVCKEGQESEVYNKFKALDKHNHILGYIEGGVNTWLEINPEKSLQSNEFATPQQLAEKYIERETNPNISIIDLRQPPEFTKDGHLQKSTKISVWELEQKLKENPKLLDPSHHHYLICKSGGRVTLAQTILSQYNIKNTYNCGGVPDIIKAQTSLPFIYEV